MWRTRFRGGFGPVVRQNAEWWMMKILIAKTPWTWQTKEQLKFGR